VLGNYRPSSIVISGFFGMNTKGLPWIDSPHGAHIALGLMAVTT